MNTVYAPSSTGPAMGLVRIAPAVHTPANRDSWTVDVESVCSFSPDPTTTMGQQYSTVSSSLLQDIGQKYLVYGAPTAASSPSDCFTNRVSIVQPEIVVLMRNLDVGTYVLNIRAWGRHVLGTAEASHVTMWPRFQTLFGGRSLIPQPPSHGWWDYASVLVIPTPSTAYPYAAISKVLGPLGVPLYISEIALYKIP
ncbi:MAG: hypothetical protein IPP90_02310 [Gemmatimonadaceae bacterium]|nr:hypothetical protein [Gemmatimonadaceae bacterium]